MIWQNGCWLSPLLQSSCIKNSDSVAALKLLTLTTGCCRESIRWKNVLQQGYHRPKGSGKKSRKRHIGVKALSSEYVKPGQILALQRRYVAHNPNVTRKRHFKIYPGENVAVDRKTSLYSTAWGRVKMTHDIFRNIFIMNVLPEVREELLPYDLWRYRLEKVRSMEENRNICWLRTKAGTIFPKPLVNPPTKQPPSARPKHIPDVWENWCLPDSKLRDIGYPIAR